MDNSDFAFMITVGLGIIVFNKAFAKSMLKSTIGVKVTEADLPRFRIFSVISGIVIILLALFFKYINEWQFR